MSDDASCQKVVNDLTAKRIAADLPPISTATGAFCKARLALSLDMISGLTSAVAVLMGDQVCETWKFLGRNTPWLTVPQ